MNWKRAYDFLHYETFIDWCRTYLTNNPPMPVNLVSVRHGQSELNEANQMSRDGDNSAFTEDFRNTHESQFRLTPLGRVQAQLAGAWIRRYIKFKFSRFYVSEFVRAKETAALLDLVDASWYVDYNLRERDWGELGVMPADERAVKFANILRLRQLDSFFWCPPSGESEANLGLRINRVFGTLSRECSRDNVILVNHGEVMWSIWLNLTRMSQRRYAELSASRHPYDHIHNCQILHFTREDPLSGKIAPYYKWMRSICPTDLSLSNNEWQPIVRPRYTNEELAQMIEAYPTFINH